MMKVGCYAQVRESKSLCWCSGRKNMASDYPEASHYHMQIWTSNVWIVLQKQQEKQGFPYLLCWINALITMQLPQLYIEYMYNKAFSSET